MCDHVDPKALDPLQGVSETISRHLAIVREFALSNPTKLVAVVSPLVRHSPAWFHSQYVLMEDVFKDLFSQSSAPNVYRFSVPEPSTLKFSGDHVHLTEKSGGDYVYDLFKQCGELLENVAKFSSTLVSASTSSPLLIKPKPKLLVENSMADSDSDGFLEVESDHDTTIINRGDQPPSTIHPTPTPSSGPVTMDMLYSEIRKNNEIISKVQSHDRALSVVQSKMVAGFKSSDLAITRIYEEQDFQKNVSKENRVTIGSLIVNDMSSPKDRASWIKLITDKVQAIIDEVFRSSSQHAMTPKLIGVALRSTRLNFKKEFPNFDAIFESSTHALVFRRTLELDSRQLASKFKNLFVSNSVTLSARVRIEIMVALSRHLNGLGFVCHVQSFVSRPVIHVKPKSSAVSRAYTFINCVREFSAYFKSLDLTSAYRRAGTAFDGVLSRFFVVLDDERSKAVSTARQKRPHPDNQAFNVGKRQK